jgi:hypothetical protein
MPDQFTPDQIVDGITQAIREHQFGIVESLLKLLAVQDPGRAQDILDTIDLANIIAAARTDASQP